MRPITERISPLFILWVLRQLACVQTASLAQSSGQLLPGRIRAVWQSGQEEHCRYRWRQTVERDRRRDLHTNIQLCCRTRLLILPNPTVPSLPFLFQFAYFINLPVPGPCSVSDPLWRRHLSKGLNLVICGVICVNVESSSRRFRTQYRANPVGQCGMFLWLFKTPLLHHMYIIIYLLGLRIEILSLVTQMS